MEFTNKNLIEKPLKLSFEWKSELHMHEHDIAY